MSAGYPNWRAAISRAQVGTQARSYAQVNAGTAAAMMGLAEARRDFTAAKRKELAASGAALPDGSFPIETVEDLHNAVHDIGRASDPAAAKAHIRKRAKALGVASPLAEDKDGG